MGKIEESIWECIEPKVKELGCSIYDIEYLKEGTNWYLRIYIDKPEGVSINDCEDVSRAIDPLIDKLNPIKTSYSLEVSSPGIERTLRRNEHFTKYLNSEVEVSLFKPIDGEKKIKGILNGFDDEKLKINNIDIDRKNITVVKTVYNF